MCSGRILRIALVSSLVVLSGCVTSTPTGEFEQAEADELAQSVSVPELSAIDLVICLDVTGSMVEGIGSLKSQVASLAEILNKIAPTGIGVIAFGDEEWDQTLYVQEVTTSSLTIQQFSF